MSNKYILANRTDVGCVRSVNEDSMVTFDSPNGRVVAVCDGMGGQAAGDVASRLACDIISDILRNNVFSSPTEAITRACLAANQGVLHRASQNPDMQGMGATCVMVIIKDGLVYYGWIGDSRIYYIHNGVIQQLSRDQSYVQQLVDSGQISSAEAEHHPQKNEITNALGLDTMTPPELCVSPLKPEEGSVIMLCSDGLSGMVEADTLCGVISDNSVSLQQRADSLVEIAKANGGHDNITVQLVEFSTPRPVAAVNAATPEQAAESKTRMIYYILAVVLIVAAGIGGWLYFGGNDNDEKNGVKTIVTEQDSRHHTAPAAAPAKSQKAASGKSVETKHTKTTVVHNQRNPNAKKPETKKPNANPKSNTAPKNQANPKNDAKGQNNVVKDQIKPKEPTPKPNNQDLLGGKQGSGKGSNNDLLKGKKGE